MGILNIYEVTSLVFWITKWHYGNIQKLTSWVFWNSYSKLHFFEYSKYPWHHFKNIQNTNVTMNIQNIHVTYSKLHDFFWIFKIPMTSLQEYSEIALTSAFEYSQANTMGIFWIFMSWVFWILTKCHHGNIQSWRHVYFEYSVTLIFWIFLKWRHRPTNEYSKYPWRQLMNNSITSLRIQNTNDITS